MEEAKKEVVPTLGSTPNGTKDSVNVKRQIIIETDGNSINIVKAEVSGSIELKAIFETLVAFMESNKK